MQESSSDEEFHDAIGDEVQLEEIKKQAKESVEISFPSTIRPNQLEKNHHSHNGSPEFSLRHVERNRTLRLMMPDENENTLTISEIKEASTSKNLQQLLEKLDETSYNISSEAQKIGGTKHKDESESKESGSESSKNTPVKSKNKNLAFSFDQKTTNADDNVNQSTNRSPESARTSSSAGRNFTKNPLHIGVTSGNKKSFFSSIVQPKRMNGSEFTKENVRQHNKSTSNFDKLICLQAFDDENRQDVSQTTKKIHNASPTWVARFSPNNRLLATGGSDSVLRIFTVTIMDDEQFSNDGGEGDLQILDPNYKSLQGHKFDIIDISWYKDSNLVLTSGIDKMVILWNIEQQAVVKIFEHSDIVPCISFHPMVDEFFASGCFDKMVRIWDLNEAKVVDWIQTTDIITALAFSPDKNFLLVGFYKGTVKIYRTDQGKLKFTMEITCKNTFVWGKLNKVGKKVTGIIFTEDYEFLVMTNDSRMRLIDLRTYETKIKYKGHSSGKYHIQPSYNFAKELILSGSEDEKVYVWSKTCDNMPLNHQTGLKASRNTSYEYFKPFPKANTTCAVWVPFPALQKYKEKMLSVWRDIYVDNLMVLFSSESKVKVLGNLIELEDPTEKK